MGISAINNSEVNKLSRRNTNVPGNIDTKVSNLTYSNQNISNVTSKLAAISNSGNAKAAIIPGTTKVAGNQSWTASQIRVVGPFNAPGSNPSAPGANNAASIDAGFNGNAYRVLSTNHNNVNQPPVIFINGINTNLPGARQTAASLSVLTGTNVDLVYNSSDPAVGAKKTYAHFDRVAQQRAAAAASRISPYLLNPQGGSVRQDVYNATYTVALASSSLGNEAGDWAKRNVLHNPPASQTAANLILEQLQNTSGPVKVVGYSQGGAIAADALRRVETQLVHTYGEQRANQMLSRVRFLGIGAAATGNDFPNSVRFNGLAHTGDPIPRYFGITRRGDNPGVGATLSALNNVGVGQHVNYLDGQGTPGSQGDPAVERLVQQWYSGINVGSVTLPNVRLNP